MNQIKFTTLRLFAAALLMCAALSLSAQDNKAQTSALQYSEKDFADKYTEAVEFYLKHSNHRPMTQLFLIISARLTSK